MKVAIIANCQGDMVARCANEMVRGHQFVALPDADFSEGRRPIFDVFVEYHKVFAQKNLGQAIPEEFRSRVTYFPVIAFNGFHPDMTYLRAKKPGADVFETVTNTMVMYHSAILIWAFTKGLSIDAALEFFNAEHFAKLGYFDIWAQAKQHLLKEGLDTNMPLATMFRRWERRGCFMHSMNHPDIHTMVDITRELLITNDFDIFNQNVDNYFDDYLSKMSIWPVYPSIAERLGLHGDYAFKHGMLVGTSTLREFAEESYDIYSRYDRQSFSPTGFSIADYDAILDKKATTPVAVSSSRFDNPYKHVAKSQFWRNAVASVEPSSLDPVVSTRFRLGQGDRIATAGSCFAQNISRTLASSGFNYFVTETPGTDIAASDAKERNFGVYSARYGNIYSVRQLLQLVRRVNGTFVPVDSAWTRADGKLVDPFRPQIEPAGFADHDALNQSRDAHMVAVRKMLAEMDVFVFTMGLTESWRSKIDGAIFPLAPGVAGGEVDFDKYEFVNFDVDQIFDDLSMVIEALQIINPSCRVILTVSPVPLIATYEPQHALVATTYSKSVLRTVASYATKEWNHVDYFPSFEIITGSFNKGSYYEDDLRNINEVGVSHAMRIFSKHYLGADQAGESAVIKPLPEARAPTGRPSIFDIVCDEEAIARL